MNWWQQWKWLKKRGCAYCDFKEYDYDLKRYFYSTTTELYTDDDIFMGSFNIRRDWIERL